MPIESIQLTGSAVHGINGPNHPMAANISSLPTRVCLGRTKPRARPSCLKLDAYLKGIDAGTLPSSTNWAAKAVASIVRMYRNDALGCCVFTGKFHSLGVWSANDSDSPGIILATDAEVQKQYFDYTGGRDAGANITEVLDIFRSRGLVAGGKTYKIDGYVSVDNSNQVAVKVAQILFGASTIGIDLPDAWTSNNVWDVTNTRIVGGHDVSPVDYTADGVIISSWGRLYLITWAAFLSQKWITEYYAMLAPSWYGSDMIAPCGLKVDELKTDLGKIGNGVIPDIGPPIPVDPVAPNCVRLTKPMGKGSYEGGTIILGSNMGAGEYTLLLGGDGPPPTTP